MKKRNYARRYPSDYNWFRTCFYLFFLYTVVMPVAKLGYQLKVVGKENIPKGTRFIFAANHVSMVDSPFLAYAVGKTVAYMAKKELFKDTGFLQWLVKRLGAFAIDREKPEISTFKTARDIFTTSWSMGIFPEGGIRYEKKFTKIQRGFAVLAKNVKADIIPVSIINFDGYAKKLFDKNMTIKIGKPISHELPVEEIVDRWIATLCEDAGYEDCTKDSLEN